MKSLQIDLEAIGILFTLRRFQNYVLESSEQVVVVADNQPSSSIFNRSRKEPIRTQLVKPRHKDVQYKVVYQKRKIN